MILLAQLRATQDGLPVMKSKIVKKWRTDNDFGFDITKPYAWKKLLQGMNLPKKDQFGAPFLYRVYVWGNIKGVKKSENISGKTLFPATPDGDKLPLYPYGVLL